MKGLAALEWLFVDHSPNTRKLCSGYIVIFEWNKLNYPKRPGKEHSISYRRILTGNMCISALRPFQPLKAPFDRFSLSEKVISPFLLTKGLKRRCWFISWVGNLHSYFPILNSKFQLFVNYINLGLKSVEKDINLVLILF